MEGTAPKDRLDRGLRDLRISITDRCNYRCSYCMPEEVLGHRYEFLPKDRILSFEEIERVARAAVALGVRKLRLTGGEPLLRADLAALVERLAALEGVEDLGLTTNGHLLAGYAAALRAAGLQRVTVSLDSLDEEVFKTMAGRRAALAPVLAGIEAALEAGLGPVKVNCVVKRGVNDHTLLGLVERFRSTPVVVRFIEYMDVGTLNDWNLASVVTAREIREAIHARFPLVPLEANYPGEVATRFRFRDGAGEIGIIASVSAPFCRGCTRARLTPEGRLVTCLFAEQGHDLRGPLRAGASDAELRERIARVWLGRDDRYSEERTAHTRHRGKKLEMYHLGG